MRLGPAMVLPVASTYRALPARCAPPLAFVLLWNQQKRWKCPYGTGRNAVLNVISGFRQALDMQEYKASRSLKLPSSECHWLPDAANPMQGVLDASGMCCYGTVDSFGVCNGWDASGQIAVMLLAGSASLASTSAVAGFLGTSVNAVHAVQISNGWATLPFPSLKSL